MKIKNVIIILVVLLVVSFAYFYIRSVKVSEKLDSEEVSIPVVDNKELENKPAIEMSTGPVFTDNEFGFQMTFPDAWKGYGFRKVKNNIYWNYTSIVFGMPIKNDPVVVDGFSAIFFVNIFPKSEYYKIPKDAREQGWADDAPGIYLTEDENYVITWKNGVQDYLPPSLRKNLDGVPDVLKTFKFNK